MENKKTHSYIDLGEVKSWRPPTTDEVIKMLYFALTCLYVDVPFFDDCEYHYLNNMFKNAEKRWNKRNENR